MMNFFKLFLLVFVSLTIKSCKGSLSSIALQAESDINLMVGAHKTPGIRVKRQAMCVAACVQKMAKKLGNEFKQSSSGMIDPKMFNASAFEKLCNIYKKGKTCIDECEWSAVVNNVKTAFKSLDYLCVDHYDDFMDHTTCYIDSHPTVGETCDPTCGDHSTLNILRQRQEAAKADGDLAGMGEVLSCMCTFLKCQLSCSIPIYDETCEDDAPGKFMVDFSESTFKALENLMENNGMGFMFPQECRDVANANFNMELNPENAVGLPCVRDLNITEKK